MKQLGSNSRRDASRLKAEAVALVQSIPGATAILHCNSGIAVPPVPRRGCRAATLYTAQYVYLVQYILVFFCTNINSGSKCSNPTTTLADE